MTPEGRVLAALRAAARSHGLGFLRLALQPGVGAGWPDALIIGRGGHVLWVEAKAPGKTVRPAQAARLRYLWGEGHDAVVVDSVDAAREALDEFAERLEYAV